MKKIISFCLWGCDIKYTIGAIKNAKLANEIYKGWVCRFYVASSVPKEIIDQLNAFDNVEVIQRNESGDWRSMLWRFDAAFGDDYKAIIFRDTDSRLNLREKAAVDQWLSSDDQYHIMRDHPHHKFPILGGMWGMKNELKEIVTRELKIFQNSKSFVNVYGVDYSFFNGLYYKILSYSMVHDPFYAKVDFPTKREGFQFVGQSFLADESAYQDHIDALKYKI